MGANDRTVQHLHLRASNAQAVTRALARLEDALRCASLPDTGERLLLVRQLHLGRLPADLSSQGLSLLIEQRVQAAGGSWVHGEQASAAESLTVFFASRLQAVQAAVRRRAEGRSLAAWHWRLALPGVQLEASDQVFLHGVVAVLAREPTAPASLPALVADVVTAGHAPWLIRHVSEETSSCLLSLGGAQRHVVGVEREWAAAVAGPPGVRAPVLETSGTMGFRYRGAGAPGSKAVVDLHAPMWVHAVLRAANWAPMSAVVAVATSATESPTLPKGAASPERETVLVALSTAGLPPIPSTPHPSAAASAERVRDDSPHAAQQIHEGPLASADRPAGAADPSEQQTPVVFDDLAPTRAGGLLFLIPVLERLGFGEWQRQNADRPLAGLMLRQVLQRLRVPEDDALWALVASLPMPPPLPSAHWETPFPWHDDRRGIGHDPGGAVPADEMAHRWRLACSLYLRRVPRIGLARLCLRRARVRWSSTHVDVCFSLADADLRVRQAGLDVDPGWVDWLQRVVRFEYMHEDAP